MKESAYLLNLSRRIMSTLTHWLQKNDVIVYDQMLMPVLLMVFVSTWKRFTYRHNDLASMEKNLSVLPN
jgi:glycine C-acetyltransferase